METKMELQNEAPVDIEQIMQGLGSRSANERAQSEAALRERSQEDVITGLIVTLSEESRRQKKRKRLLVSIALTYMVAMLSIVIFAHQTSLIGTVTSMTSLIVVGFTATQKQKAATKVLAQYDDVRGVGLLTEMLAFPLEKELRAEIETALIRLLPRLKASDAALLSEEQRGVLVSVVAGRQSAASNTALVVAILKALEQVGDEKALPAVTKLAEGRGIAKFPGSPTHIAAQECLPYLQARVERQHAGEQLLRASSGAASATSAEELLRPAEGSGVTPPDQLLRAGGDGNSPA